MRDHVEGEHQPGRAVQLPDTTSHLGGKVVLPDRDSLVRRLFPGPGRLHAQHRPAEISERLQQCPVIAGDLHGETAACAGYSGISSWASSPKYAAAIGEVPVRNP